MSAHRTIRKHGVEEMRMRFRLTSLLATVLVAGGHAMAQTKATLPDAPGPSRVDLYGGYAYFHPQNSGINGYLYQPINPGAVVSVTGYFNRTFGVQAEGGFHPSGPNDCVYTAQAGPVARRQYGRFVPFVHVLGGSAKVGGPVFQPCTWGYGFTGGLGFDYVISQHFAIRPIQADFVYTHVNYGPLVQPGGVNGGTGQIDAYRLSSGLVIRFGDMTPHAPLTLACTVQPMSGFSGDPLTVSGTVQNADPKKRVTYTWSSTGGTVSGSDVTASIDTSRVAPGDYVVTGHASEGSHISEQASCAANFTVRAFAPPTISCSADPSSVQAGNPSTITAIATSPQNRPLSYSYSASSGQITGNGTTATLITPAAAPGQIIVTCNAVDDRGQSASAPTVVTVMAPTPVSAPNASDLCSVSFARDVRRPVRVDNEGKACLDDIALTMGHNIDARLILVGHAARDERPGYASERALNVRDYLVHEKAIDPERIQVREGSSSGRSVTNILIPVGATFDGTGTTPVDEQAVHRSGEAYGRSRR
jgi:hypothetical protein